MLEQLQKALSDAYTLQTLSRMVKFKLGKDLDDIAAPSNKQQVIFELLDAAQREGFLEKLIVGARAFNPGNEVLRDFSRQYGLESTRKSTQELERIIDDTKPNLDPVQLRQSIFEAETRVCRVEVGTSEGTVYGTGFLVSADLVMTNYHVVDSAITGAVPSTKVAVRFDYKKTLAKIVNPGTVCKLAPAWLLDSSEPGPLDEPSAQQLDYAILQLAATPPAPSDSSRGFYQIGDRSLPVENDPLFIMQHPSARATELAMDTKAVLRHNNAKTRIHYRTNTEPGSSGSPCFTPDFDLVALHQSGDPDFDDAHKPTYNQGVPIGAIATLLKSRGHATRLGIA